MSGNLFAHYKPLRNYLAAFDLWTGLGTVYAYMQFRQFRQRLPDPLLTQRLQIPGANLEAHLPGHLLELLARELLLNAQPRGGKPFANAGVAFKAIRMIHEVDNTSWGLHDSRSNDIVLHLSRIAFKQFPWQNKLTNTELARYHHLYAHPSIAPMVEAEFGMTTNELFQVTMLLVEELLHRPTPAFTFLQPADPSIRAPVWALADRLSRSAHALRESIREGQSFDVNWAYSFNPIRRFPLIHAGNPRSLFCPIPTFLFQRLTDGLYFDLMRADAKFGDAAGKAFESYVGSVGSRIGGEAFDLREEACWGKPERRSVDWLVIDPSAVLFVECKLGRLDIASQTEITAEPPLVDAIKRLASGVGQLYATLGDALAGAYPHWQPDDRPIYPLLVTFHEWFAFGPLFFEHLDQLVKENFVKRGLDLSLLERFPFSVCSIAEFEALLIACRDNSIDHVLAKKLSPDHRQWLWRGFLADQFPGAIHSAAGILDDRTNLVINGPSRLTPPYS